MTEVRLRARVLVLVSVCALGAGIALRERTSIWSSTGAAGALSLALLALWFRPQFARLWPRSAREALHGVVTGALMAVATWLIYPVATRFMPGLDIEVAALYGEIDAWPGRWRALPLLVAIIVSEECVFRGVLMDDLLASGARTPVSAVLIATAIYSVPQLVGGSWVLVSLALSCGAIWSSQRARTGSVAIPFLTHLVWDVLVFVAWPVR